MPAFYRNAAAPRDEKPATVFPNSLRKTLQFGGRSFSSDIKCSAIMGLGRPWASAQGAKRP